MSSELTWTSPRLTVMRTSMRSAGSALPFQVARRSCMAIAQRTESGVADRLHLVAAESLHHGQEERVVEAEHARVLLARLAAGPGGEALHVGEEDGEVLRSRRGAQKPADLVRRAHSAPRICSRAS